MIGKDEENQESRMVGTEFSLILRAHRGESDRWERTRRRRVREEGDEHLSREIAVGGPKKVNLERMRISDADNLVPFGGEAVELKGRSVVGRRGSELVMRVSSSFEREGKGNGGRKGRGRGGVDQAGEEEEEEEDVGGHVSLVSTRED
jgi:hypothetical protein